MPALIAMWILRLIGVFSIGLSLYGAWFEIFEHGSQHFKMFLCVIMLLLVGVFLLYTNRRKTFVE